MNELKVQMYSLKEVVDEELLGTFTEGGTYIPLVLKMQQQLMVIVQHK